MNPDRIEEIRSRLSENQKHIDDYDKQLRQFDTKVSVFIKGGTEIRTSEYSRMNQMIEGMEGYISISNAWVDE